MTTEGNSDPCLLVRTAIGQLLTDPLLPQPVACLLQPERTQLHDWSERLGHSRLHLAVYGRVSVGKSALLNALLGREYFRVSVLNGETREVDESHWDGLANCPDLELHLLDTPGINEISGDAREALARTVAQSSDVVLFVLDGDLTDTELRALRQLADRGVHILLLLNKADRYSERERELLLTQLRQRCVGLVPETDIFAVAANPALRTVIEVDESGRERERRLRPSSDIEPLRQRLDAFCRRDGRRQAALGAGLLACQYLDRVASEISALRRIASEQWLQQMALLRAALVGVLVAWPMAAILVALTIDGIFVARWLHLHAMSWRRSAWRQIAPQWALQLGLLVLAIALGQWLPIWLQALFMAALAWWGAQVLGRAIRRHCTYGRGWETGGVKSLVASLLNDLPTDAPLSLRRDALLARLRPAGTMRTLLLSIPL